MKTVLLKAEAGIAQAIDLLAQETVVALPTETVYGLAGDGFSPAALVNIFEAKQRPLSDPLILHLLDASWLDQIVLLTPQLKRLVRQLAEAFWPGPLTLLLPRNKIVPDLVTAGMETVAVRVPSHPVMREVLARFGRPLAAPSANRFGCISPTTAGAVLSELGGEIPLILDGGPCGYGLESTILWIREDKEVGPLLQILRPGPITAEELAAFGHVVAHSVEGKAPGSLQSHYAPRKKLSWYDPSQPAQSTVGLLAFCEEVKGFRTVEILSPSADLKEVATNLYGALRRLDESDATSLVVQPMPEEGIGVAIMDRLRRAVTNFKL